MHHFQSPWYDQRAFHSYARDAVNKIQKFTFSNSAFLPHSSEYFGISMQSLTPLRLDALDLQLTFQQLLLCPPPHLLKEQAISTRNEIVGSSHYASKIHSQSSFPHHFLVNRAAPISVSLAFAPHSYASTVNAAIGSWSSSSTVKFTPMLFPKVLNAK